MATTNDKVEKIYVVKGEGTGALIKDLDAIEARFKNVKKAKQDLDNEKAGTQNAAQLAEIDKRLAALAKREKEYQDALAARIAQEQASAQVNTQLTGTYEQMSDAIAAVAAAGAAAPGAVAGDPGNTQAQTEAVEGLAAAQDQLAGATQAAAGAANSQAQADAREMTEVERLAQSLFNLQGRRVQLTAALKANGQALKAGTISQQEYLQTGTRLTAELAEVNQEISRNRIELRAQILSNQSAETSIRQLTQVLGILRAQYRDLTAEQRRSAEGRELLKNIQELDKEYKKLEATIGNFKPNVGNYASGFDGIGNSLQQILREAPSAAVSLNTFFLAISNNLPQFFDEITKIQKQYGELKAAAEAAAAAQSTANVAAAAAGGATDEAVDGLESQITAITEGVGASREQAIALREQIAETVASGAADAEAAVAAGTHAEALAVEAGATLEQAAALGVQTTAAAQATAATAAATVALEAETVAALEANAALTAQPSVLSRLKNSLFSVNTALTLGVLALTLFGGKAIAAVESLAGVTTETKEAEKAAKKYKETIENLASSEERSAQQEIATVRVLVGAAKDRANADEVRLAAVNKLQTTYPERFANLTQEAILEGKVGDAVEKTTDQILKRARTNAALKRVGAAAEQAFDIEQQLKAAQEKLEDAQKKFDELSAAQKRNPTNSYLANAAVRAATDIETAQKAVDSLKKTYSDALAEQEKYAKEAEKSGITADRRAPKGSVDALREEIAELEKLNGLQERGSAAQIESAQKLKKLRAELKTAEGRDADPKVKPVVTHYGDELKAAKDYNEEVQKLQAAQVQADEEENRAIFENERKNLQDRLLAYENYASDKLYEAAGVRDRELADAAAVLKTTKETLEGGKKLDKTQKAALLQQQENANKQIQRANEQYNAAKAEIDRKALTDTAAIVASDIEVRLRGIDTIRATVATETSDEIKLLQESYGRKEISLKQYKIREKAINTEAHVYELELIKTFLQQQIDAVEATGQSAQKIKAQLQQVNIELQKAKSDAFDAAAKKDFDLKQFYKELKSTAADAGKSIADGFIQNSQRQIDKDIELREQLLETERQKRLAAAQSVAEQEAVDREFDQKKEVLEKEAFERRKKLAEKQLAVEFIVASIKAYSAGLETGGIPGGFAAVALTALEYAAKYAALQAQQYEEGGEVPSSGGEFGGRPHSQGGTRFRFKGREFEAEAEELSIINKRSAASRDRLTVSGTVKQIASALNAHGGGRVFAPGARVDRFEYGGSLGASLPAPYLPPSYGPEAAGSSAFMRQAVEMMGAINGRIDRLQVVVDPTAIDNANENRNKIARLGKL